MTKGMNDTRSPSVFGHCLNFLTIALASIPALSQESTGTSVGDDSSLSPAGLVHRSEEAQRWFVQTLSDGYKKSRHTSSKWDSQVQRLFESYAATPDLGSSQSTNYWKKMVEIADELAKAGCSDPAVDYIRLRLDSGLHAEPDAIRAAKLSAIAEQMDLSKHHDLLKAFASVRASQGLKAAMPAKSKQPPRINQLRQKAAAHLEKLVADKSIPADMIAEITELIMEAVRLNPSIRDDIFQRIEEPLNQNWPNSARLLLLQGSYYIKYAWAARGSDYADKVSDKGWELFSQRLSKAEQLLERAWKLDPKNKRIE